MKAADVMSMHGITSPDSSRRFKSSFLRNAVRFAAIIVTVVVILIVGYLLIKGVSNISWDFLVGEDGVLPMIISTLMMIALSLVIAVPLGIACAVYLAEYSKKGSRLVRTIRIATQSLSGIPSILYGLFGMLFFVIALGWSWSVLSGALTLSIMVLPTIISSTEEALMAVPDAYREGSFGVGAGKVRTVLRIVLPNALPGILAAVILSMGRIVGESAAVMLTAGTVSSMPESVFDSGRTLAVHMYILAKEGIDFSMAYSTALVLIVVILLLNFMANRLIKRVRKGMQ